MFGFFPLAKFFLKPVREHLRRLRKARRAVMANVAAVDTRGRQLDSEAEARTPPVQLRRSRGASRPLSRASSRVADRVAVPEPPSALLMETFSPPSQRGRATTDESSEDSWDSSRHSHPRGRGRTPSRSRQDPRYRSTSAGHSSSGDEDEIAHRRLTPRRRGEGWI